MAKSRDNFFYSNKKVGVVVEPGAMEQLPANIKEAIHQRSNNDEAEDPTIKMLKEQLKDPKLPPFFKTNLEETLIKLEQQKLNSNTETKNHKNSR